MILLYTQREFVLGLIEEALNEAERLVAEETRQTTGEASVGPCESLDTEEEAQAPGEALKRASGPVWPE